MDKDIAVYMRVSSDEQRERQTIVTQHSQIERYLDQNGMMERVYSWYGDDGVSGTVPFERRPEAHRLLMDLRSGHIKLVIVYRVDRIGREASIILNTVSVINQLGAQFKSMSEDFDSKNPAGQFMLTMLSGFAGYDKASVVERTTGGLRRVIQEGAWIGNVPYGCKTVGRRAATRLAPSEDLQLIS